MVFWEGASMWVLGTRPGDAPYPRSAPHSHHAVQLTLCLRGGFRLETGDDHVSGPAAAVAPDTEHTFEAHGAVAHLFIDPEGRSGRELQRVLFSRAPLVAIPAIVDLSRRLLAAFEAPRRKDQTLIELGRAVVAELAPEGERDLRPAEPVNEFETPAGISLVPRSRADHGWRSSAC